MKFPGWEPECLTGAEVRGFDRDALTPCAPRAARPPARSR